MCNHLFFFCPNFRLPMCCDNIIGEVTTMKKLLALVLIALVVLGMTASAETVRAADACAAFLDAVDPDFAYGVAYELTTNPLYWSTTDLGGRNAGSEAEHNAAAYLAEQMSAIGLSDVTLQSAQCDLWSNNGSTLTIGENSYAVYSYATAATPAEGLTAEIVYMNEGTMWDYEGVDVTDKIVLIDVDQRANWWITYPMLEAEAHGAAAIISANSGGYAQIADDALNAQDICAGASIPCVSIGRSDSESIQAMLAQGPVTATLTVDNDVEIDAGTTYNVTGVLKGKSSDFQIIVGGHYDMHFYGFQDDNCAVGLVLAMAKAMVDSGYQPENDIVFCLHGAEEWGSSYTMYDWTVGAWEMINHQRPDWIGRTLAFINFELPAYEFDTYTSTYSAPEMYSLLDWFANECAYSPEPVDCFADGVRTAGYQTYTYSDDFSYYAAGVPSMVNGFLLKDDMSTVFDFYVDIYHSQYDTPDTYNEAVMDFNLRYYGALAVCIDRMPALYLDFTAQADRIEASIDEEIMTAAGVDVSAYRAALEKLRAAAGDNLAEVQRINAAYEAALDSGDATQAEALLTEGRALTARNLEAFRFAQTGGLLGLMYERPIVPHEAPQENILLEQTIVDLLAQGDVQTAADEYAWQVNNVLEWYAMYFSEEVIAAQDDMMWGDSNAENLYWGTGISFDKSDVDAATRSLMARYDEIGGDFSEEIAIYEAAITVEAERLNAKAAAEILAMETLCELLQTEA